MLAGAPSFADVAGDIQRLFRDRIPVAHNLRFDWDVLRRAYAPLGVDLPFAPAGVCTVQLARLVLGGGVSLPQICQRLGITHQHPHRAGPDAAATAAVFLALRHALRRGGSGRPCPPFPGAWRLAQSTAPMVRLTSIAVTGERSAGWMEAEEPRGSH